MEAWFAGQSAVVTGAAHGIGLAIAELLDSLGARVIAVDNDEAALEERFREGRQIRWPGDLAGGETAQLAEDIWQRHGPIELLVNNVGIDTGASFLELEEPDFDAVFATNLRGPWFFTRRIARNLVDTGRTGGMVFVSSLHDTFVCARPHYSASKAAVAMLVKELANELAPHGIRVNAVSPGTIRSRHDPPATRDFEAWVTRVVPVGRRGEPADVARMVAVLLSDEWAGYVTGTNVRVDGGLGLHSWTGDQGSRAGASEPAGLRRRALRLKQRRLR